MKFRLMVVDDDKALRRILANIIENNNLGEIVDEASDGEEAEGKIIALKPDIVLMDLLLPGKDGIEVIHNIKKRGIKTYFIMISQVEAEDLVTQAYKSGIEFFIHKPINTIETIKVISKVEEIIKLKTTFQMVRDTVISIEKPDSEIYVNRNTSRIDFLLADLGILGEAGSEDIRITIENYDSLKDNINNLQDLYEFLHNYYISKGKKKSSDSKAIEMRIRRAITKALQNIASMGTENYDSEQFLRYAPILFDFKEIKKEMDYVRGKSKKGGKINIKKFIEGSILLCKE
ncbi:Chemotaxis protein CheY [Koleobacter methoxysyntrophicus]|uniref:Stage 0 sporulation protein A homolog n=1 Tax=Koleobacter methoxysyntrophicus TaxID=2751313 RepID=A0A8A0RRW1_9FIRM|nr:DNA-binding domain-containing protein [Koleobacter methoxysyntrophicus]QSQ10249.1 Chemotaxis protein CheY [Koleobacter methoxysyntrophicus]